MEDDERPESGSLNSLSALNDKITGTISSLVQQRDEYETLAEIGYKCLKGMEEANSKLEKRLRDVEQARHQLEQNYQALERRITTLQENYGRVDSKHNELGEKYNRLREEYDSSKGDVKNLEGTIAEVKSSVQTLNDGMETLGEWYEYLNSQLGKARSEHDTYRQDTEKRMTRLENRVFQQHELKNSIYTPRKKNARGIAALTVILGIGIASRYDISEFIEFGGDGGSHTVIAYVNPNTSLDVGMSNDGMIPTDAGRDESNNDTKTETKLPEGGMYGTPAPDASSDSPGEHLGGINTQESDKGSQYNEKDSVKQTANTATQGILRRRMNDSIRLQSQSKKQTPSAGPGTTTLCGKEDTMLSFEKPRDWGNYTCQDHLRLPPKSGSACYGAKMYAPKGTGQGCPGRTLCCPQA